MNPFDFFDKIYCINLDENPERWEQAKIEFQNIGIGDRVERFPGIKHERGVIGCLISHINCVQQAHHLGHERIFVFEDDVKFLNNDMDTLQSSIDSLQKIPDWDLFYLGGRLMKRAEFITPNLIESKLLAAHAYGVNLKSIEKFQEPYSPVDVFYSYNMNSYAIYPLMAVQHAGYSDIERRHVDYKENAYKSTYETLAKGPKS